MQFAEIVEKSASAVGTLACLADGEEGRLEVTGLQLGSDEFLNRATEDRPSERRSGSSLPEG